MAKEETDDLFEGTTDGDESVEQSGDTEVPAPVTGADSDESSDPKVDDKDKRIRDLMSRAQKAEAALAKASKAQPKDDTPAPEAEADGEDEFASYMRESVRRQIHGEFGLDDFGIEVSAVAGNSVAEMRKSAQAQKRMVETLETKLRSKVLEEHGLNPDIEIQPEKKVDFASMSNEDFEKWYEARKNR